MKVKKMVFVLILQDQNGMAAEVFPEISLLKKRVREIVEEEYKSSINRTTDSGWRKQKETELKRLLTKEDIIAMVEQYEEGKSDFGVGDSSERMWAIESPYIE